MSTWKMKEACERASTFLERFLFTLKLWIGSKKMGLCLLASVKNSKCWSAVVLLNGVVYCVSVTIEPSAGPVPAQASVECYLGLAQLILIFIFILVNIGFTPLTLIIEEFWFESWPLRIKYDVSTNRLYSQS
jgi:hypothetical protein